MTSAQDKILAMIASQKVTEQEGEQLLAAIQRKRSRIRQLLLNPFDLLSDWAVVAIAAVACAAQIVIPVMLPVRFDGALDVHVTRDTLPLFKSAGDLALGWLTTVALLWLVSAVLRHPGRVVDFLAAFAVARMPLFVVALVSPLLASGGDSATPAALAVVAMLLPCVAWSFVLLFQGFKTASGLAGARLWVAFFIAILSAELLSKLLLTNVG